MILKSTTLMVSLLGSVVFSSMGVAPSVLGAEAEFVTISYDDKRFNKKNILDELNLFQSYQKDKSKDNKTTVQLDDKPLPHLSEITLAFNGRKQQKEDGFLYFSEEKSDAAEAANSLAPRKSLSLQSRSLTAVDTMAVTSAPALLSVPSSDLMMDVANSKVAGGMVSLNYGIREHEAGDTDHVGLDLGMKSSIQIQPVETLSAASSGNDFGLTTTAYDLDFNIGYAGFNLAAAVRRQEGYLSNGTSGYDLGVAYMGQNFSTSLMLGEHSRNDLGLLAASPSDASDRFQSVRIGASYYIGSSFSLSGGIRYEEYSDRLRLRGYGSNRSMFYLGTSLRF